MKKIIKTLSLLSSLFFMTGFTNVTSSDTPIVSIETSNVSYDLKILYAGDKWNSFDLETLKPNNNTLYDDFHFLLCNPINENLYIYAYTKTLLPLTVQNMQVRLSKSKIQNYDGVFEESYINYTARYINSYGYLESFHKFAIDNIVSNDSDNRFYIESVNIKFSSGETGYRLVQDEFCFRFNANKDIIYNYFSNDYVRITDGSVGLFLMEDKLYTGQSKITEVLGFNEHFYYFFDTDKVIDELIRVRYDYQLLTYTAKTETFHTINNKYMTGLHIGRRDDNNLVGVMNESIANFNNQEVTGERKTYDNTSSFLWFKWGVKYDYDTIIDVRDTTKIKDERFKKFIIDNGTKMDGTKWQYAFEVTTTYRSHIKSYNKYPWYEFWHTKVVTETLCHEVKQALILSLTFRTGNQLFDLNAFDIPKDTSWVYVNTIPFPLFTDVLFSNTLSFFSLLFDTGQTFFSNITMILGIVGIIIALLIISFILKILKPIYKPIIYLIKKRKKKKHID